MRVLSVGQLVRVRDTSCPYAPYPIPDNLKGKEGTITDVLIGVPQYKADYSVAINGLPGQSDFWQRPLFYEGEIEPIK